MRSLIHTAARSPIPREAITVTLNLDDTPRVNRALACLTDELNTTPHLPDGPLSARPQSRRRHRSRPVVREPAER
jgi:hypothetical protein